jgi:hypothetical protein
MYADRGALPHTPQTCPKKFDQKLYKVNFSFASCINFGFVETCVRCAGQDDDPHSGSRAKLVWVKPDKHRPGQRGGVEAAFSRESLRN